MKVQYNSNPTTENNQEEKKDFPKCGCVRTHCGLPAKEIRHASGKTYHVLTCGYEYCNICRTKKLETKNPFTSDSDCYSLVPYLVTVRLGNYLSVNNIPAFEKSVSRRARYKRIPYTFCVGYEETGGLYHAHYGVLLDPTASIDDYVEIVKKCAAIAFVNQSGPKQVDCTRYDTQFNLFTYVSKIFWSEVASFAMAKEIKKSQFRWRRGYKTFMSAYYRVDLGEKSVLSNGVCIIRSDVPPTDPKRSYRSLGMGERANQVGWNDQLGTSERLTTTPRGFLRDLLFDTS